MCRDASFQRQQEFGGDQRFAWLLGVLEVDDVNHRHSRRGIQGQVGNVDLALDVFEIKRRYGDRLSFYGGISIQRTLPYGAVDEVKDEVRRLIEVVGENGGYIASPSHDLPADAKAENVAAMIEVLRNQ